MLALIFEINGTLLDTLYAKVQFADSAKSRYNGFIRPPHLFSPPTGGVCLFGDILCDTLCKCVYFWL